MSGNVWEWCYDRDGAVSTGEETDPLGSSSDSKHIVRGGAWHNYAYGTSVCYRASELPSFSSNGVGIRLVRSAN